MRKTLIPMPQLPPMPFRTGTQSPAPAAVAPSGAMVAQLFADHRPWLL